jgi:hypothetical protein
MDQKYARALICKIGVRSSAHNPMVTTYSNIHLTNSFTNWISGIHDITKVYRFIDNCRTEKFRGEKPCCWWKIAFLLAIAGAIGALVYFGGN